MAILMFFTGISVFAVDSGISYFDGKWPQIEIDQNRDFQLGIHVHNPEHANYNGDDDSIEQYMKLVADSGATLVRTSSSFMNQSQIDYMDKYLATAEAYGLDVMFVISYNGHYTTTEEFYDMAAFVAKRYVGRIKYYQLFNETSGYCHTPTGILGYGMEINNYDIDKLAEITKYLKVVSDAIGEFDPNAKRVINTTWLHTGILKYYVANGVEFEVVGLDWYSNAEYNTLTGNIWYDRPTWSRGYSNSTSLWEDVTSSFPDKEYIVCESNYYPSVSFDEKRQTEYFMTFLNEAYNSLPKEKLLGVVVYELLDQPDHFSTNDGTVYGAEANLGLVRISNSKENNSVSYEPKQLYYVLQELFSGGTVTPDWTLSKEPIVGSECDYIIHDGFTYHNGIVIAPGGGNIAQKTFDFDIDSTGWQNNLTFRFNTAGDLSKHNALQFNLVLSDEPSVWDEWKDYCKFFITVGGTTVTYSDGISYTWPVPESLEKGKNKITLELDYIKDLGVDLSNVTRFGLISFAGNNFSWRMDGVTLEGNTTANATVPNKSALVNLDYGASKSNGAYLTSDMTVAIRNLCAINNETKSTDSENKITISNGGYGYIAKGATRLGAIGSGSDAIAYDVFDKAVDASSMEYIEFDFFISDLESLRKETRSGNSGNAYNLIVVKINSQGRMTNTGGNPIVNITGFHAALDGYTMCDLVYLDNQNTLGDEYISNSGWTHIRIPISSLSATAKKALANFKSLAIGFSPVGQATDALTQNYSFGFKNLKVTNGIPGDVNNDTEVDIRDLVRFKRHLAGADVEFKVGNSTLGIDYSLTQSMAELRKFLLGKTTLTR